MIPCAAIHVLPSSFTASGWTKKQKPLISERPWHYHFTWEGSTLPHGCGRIVFLHVRHQADVDPTVLGATGRGSVRCRFFVFAQSDHVHLVRWNFVIRSQILCHRGSTALTEVIVVLRITR